MKWIALLSFIILSGCINIDTHLQPINESVKPLLEGSDCSPIIFGLGAGINHIETAMANGSAPQSFSSMENKRAKTPITRLHSLVYHESVYLFFGMRCIEVTGEP